MERNVTGNLLPTLHSRDVQGTVKKQTFLPYKDEASVHCVTVTEHQWIAGWGVELWQQGAGNEAGLVLA
jgi:hypothetical protein